MGFKHGQAAEVATVGAVTFRPREEAEAESKGDEAFQDCMNMLPAALDCRVPKKLQTNHK